MCWGRTGFFFFFSSLFPWKPAISAASGAVCMQDQDTKKPHAAGVLLHKALNGFISFFVSFFLSLFSGFENQKFYNFRNQEE